MSFSADGAKLLRLLEFCEFGMTGCCTNVDEGDSCFPVCCCMLYVELRCVDCFSRQFDGLTMVRKKHHLCATR